MNDLHWWTATRIVDAYRRRAPSPVELVDALLRRIAALNPVLCAFVRVDEEDVRAQARRAEHRLFREGADSALCGVPVGLKDIIDVAGEPTLCHSRRMLGHVAARDAEVVRRLRSAGAILMGKQALHEFAIGGPAFDLPFPPARNPWNLDHQPGGSSSGSGAAVAAGLVPLAVGTDTGGSVRNPAGHCGVVGLKPTYGVVSCAGVFPLSYTLDAVGPLARSAADTGLLLDVLASHDPDDPGSAQVERGPYGPVVGADLRGVRVGYVRHFHATDIPATAEVARAIDTAADRLRALGADVEEVRLPSLRHFAAAQRIIFLAESWSVHADAMRERPGDYCEISRRKLLPGAFLDSSDYLEAQRHRHRLIDAVDQALERSHLLLMANAMEPACCIEDAAECVRTYPLHARSVANLTGHPAIALPAGFSAGGLPLSAQLMGRPFDENGLLRAAAALESALGWTDVHPALGEAGAGARMPA